MNKGLQHNKKENLKPLKCDQSMYENTCYFAIKATIIIKKNQCQTHLVPFSTFQNF